MTPKIKISLQNTTNISYRVTVHFLQAALAFFVAFAVPPQHHHAAAQWYHDIAIEPHRCWSALETWNVNLPLEMWRPKGVEGDAPRSKSTRRGKIEDMAASVLSDVSAVSYTPCGSYTMPVDPAIFCWYSIYVCVQRSNFVGSNLITV